MITRTINFGWNEIKETYYAECGSCGRKYKRVASTGYNDMATAENRAEYRRNLQAEAQELSQKKITCNACIKKGITEPRPLEIITPELADEIARIERDFLALKARKDAIEAHFRPHRKRLFLFEGETYSQCGAGFDPWSGKFEVDGYRISKTRPWEETVTHRPISAPVSGVAYLDDTLDERKAKAEGK